MCLLRLFLPAADFLVKLSDYNCRMPDNTWLFCGDGDLGETFAALHFAGQPGVPGPAHYMQFWQIQLPCHCHPPQR